MSSITIMTTQGRAQLAAAVANEQAMPSAKIVVGDGNGATYVPNEAQVTLVHEVWRGNATVARTDDRVIFQAVMPAEIGGFTVREVGVLIGAIGSEQLFIVSQHPATEKIAAPANGSGPLPVTIAFSANASEQAVLPIGSSDNATLQLSRAPHITVDGLVSEPPAAPVDGTLYAIATAATGLFVGKGGWLSERVAGAWIYKNPPEKSAIRLTATGAWYQRVGTDWVSLPFDDTSILWARITDPPATFPASAHIHDDRYFTETEADGRFVQLAPAGGAAQSISGSIAANGLSVAADASVGLTIGRYSVGYAGSLLSIGGTFLSAQFGGVEKLRLTDSGNLGINTPAPGEALDVAGSIALTGGIKLGGTMGTAVHVAVGGSTASWRTLAELGMGKKIIAIGMGTGAITFDAAEADTAYSGFVLSCAPYISGAQSSEVSQGSIGSKTTTGCTITAGATAGSSPFHFYIIWR